MWSGPEYYGCSCGYLHSGNFNWYGASQTSNTITIPNRICAAGGVIVKHVVAPRGCAACIF